MSHFGYIRQFLAIIAVIAVSNVIYYYLGYSQSAALSVPAFFKTAGNLFIEGVEIRQLTRQLIPYKSDIVPQNNIIAEAIIWEPIPAPKIYVDPLAVGNTYDNGLHYNVEQFFRRLLKDTIVLEHTLLLYTSDHGQTLIENGETWSHCGNTIKEAAVPLLLIGQHNFSPDTQYRATHYNIFPTILDLRGVPAEARIVTYPLSLLEATTLDSTDRYFLGGTAEAYYSVQVNFDQREE